MRPIDDKIFVAWCVLGVHSTAISSSKACELLGIGINEWRSIDISIEGARRLLSENIVSGGLLETRDLISALQEYRRYHAISVFADDLSLMARDSVRHGVIQRKYGESFYFTVVPEYGLVRLNRGEHIDTSINDLEDAITKGLLLKEGFKTPIFGLLIGDTLSDDPESFRRIFTLEFNPILQKWFVYDGGLLKWMKERLLPISRVVVSSEPLPKVAPEKVAEAIGAELTRPRWLGKRIDLEPSLRRLAKDFGLYLVNVRRDGFNSVIGLIELPDHKYVSISAAGSGETRDDIDDDIYRKLRKKMAELKKS